MRTITLNDYIDPTFIDKEMKKSNAGTEIVSVQFADGISVEMPIGMFILNLIFLEPNIRLGIEPLSTDIVNFMSFTTDSISAVQSKLYERALDERPDVAHPLILYLYTESIDHLSNFIQKYIGDQMPSIDILGLAELKAANKKIQELADYKFDDNLGTKVSETIFNQQSNELVKLIKDPKTPCNCLYPYMQAGTLKSNQIPQVLIAYGNRSDIDDTMMKHALSESSLSGLKTIEDFAIESLSAKKSIFFSRDTIRDSQYFARKLRLACTPIQHIYPGSCGSPGWIPYIIEEKYAKNYINRMVIDKDKRIVLTEDNIKNYIDKPVKLISQFACRYTDGMCEHCAGYGKDRLIKYMPADVHIGLICAMILGSIVSQKILSAKHLISTSSKIYNLTETALKYFYKSADMIYWNENMLKHFNKLKVRIPNSAFGGTISDLNLDVLPIAESYTELPFIELLDEDNNLIDSIELSYDGFTPYLSTETLEHMRDHFKDIEVDDKSTTFKIKDFDISKCFLKYTILNDDMVAYTEAVARFLSKSMADYTDVCKCMHDFAAVVYQKSSMNSFFIETVVRSHLIDPVNFNIPVITDPSNVTFGNLSDVVSESSISGKLAFEKLNSYLTKPSTPLILRKQGLFAPMFGIIK